MVEYHGTVLDSVDAIRQDINEWDYERIKSWGLNSVLFVVWWSQQVYDRGYELSELEPGIYNETNLLGLERQVSMAKAAGLKVIISSRVSYRGDGTAGWADAYGADYVNYNQQDASGSFGRERYCRFIAMLAERFRNCAIDPWLFPYHEKYTVSGDPEITFYNTTQPMLIKAIRDAGNSNPIILNPILQGDYMINGEFIQTGAFWSPNFKTHPDPNIYYGCNSHDNYNVLVEGGTWDGDIDKLKRVWQPAVEFALNHKVICVEFGALAIHGAAGERPIDPARIEWYRQSLEICRNAGINWQIWAYNRNPVEGACPLEQDLSDSAVAQLIKQYAPMLPSPLPFRDDFQDLTKWQILKGEWIIK